MIRKRFNATMTTFATLFSGGELAGVGVVYYLVGFYSRAQESVDSKPGGVGAGI